MPKDIMPTNPPKRRAAPQIHHPVENTLNRIRVAQPGMAKGASRIADYVLAQPDRVGQNLGQGGGVLQPHVQTLARDRVDPVRRVAD